MQPRDIKRRLKELLAAVKAEPGSIPKRLELAAVLREAGRPADAIDLYRGVAEAYAEDGRLVQAMAVCKGILDIDPEHRDTLEMLAALATRKSQRPAAAAVVRETGGRWVAEPTTGERAAQHDDELTRAGRIDATPSSMFAGDRTPAEGELLTPIGGDDERTPIGDPELTPLPAGDATGEPLNWRARALHELYAETGPGGEVEETRSGADREETRSGGDPDGTRAGTRAGAMDAQSRKRWGGAPRVATPVVATSFAGPDGSLDFPDETKQKARGHRLLDLTAAGDDELYPDDEKTSNAPLESIEPRSIDTDRMPTVTDEEVAATAAADATRRASAASIAAGRIDSGRLPPIPDELTFGDEDSAVQMLHEVVNGPFPRPQLTVEPPPFPLLSELPRAAFMDLLSRLSVLRLQPGETVLREGEAGDACYLVASGRVRVTKAGVEVAQLGPGSFFGEFAVLSDQRRHASVQAIEPLELLEIRRDLIDELVAAHPGVARTLRTFYRERLLATLMATAPFFQRLSMAERGTIAERFRPRRFGRGAQIIEEGAPGGGLYLILVGEVEVVRAAGGGHVVKLGLLGEGSYFGEMSLLRGGVASATVRATRMTEAVQLPPRDFYEMASQHPVLWEQLRSEAEKREMANHAILAGEARKSDTFYLV
ncbi:MAG: cyclic nucleotide-binding protein [Myxococcales bacterium]|nr:cyclic nucleotide-binding protein [Myxococcales bacterium]